MLLVVDSSLIATHTYGLFSNTVHDAMATEPWAKKRTVIR